ncbi:aldo/keto reductase [Desulfovibrio sp. JC022]|uniref:aldo/keto reductase n=1 Tax=Desulfovibrio sp. JC022 TaxID=2593642 RepID=UPI0013D555C4|nr:aldo/keto reductase [Desulfovibrio sp. JC022]NDV22165.1 aldo/keto reductase [Desulfovibrio sp. JC022]
MSKIDMSRLVLGTAQLGMSYGIANKTGQPSRELAENIVAISWESGGREFDTAQIYGNSETLLGEILKQLDQSGEAKIISKPDPKINLLQPGNMEKSVRSSLTNLNLDKFYGYMIHKEEFLPEWNKGVGVETEEIRTKGLVDKIGISVYSPANARLAIETDGVDLIQVPSSILDHRFEKEGIFDLACKKGKVIYVRSVFLQGLIFMNAEELPEHLKFAAPYIQKVSQIAQEAEISVQELALSYAAKAYPKAKILVGAELPEQMEENIKSFTQDCPGSLMHKIRSTFDSVPEKLVNPVLWT